MLHQAKLKRLREEKKLKVELIKRLNAKLKENEKSKNDINLQHNFRGLASLSVGVTPWEIFYRKMK